MQTNERLENAASEYERLWTMPMSLWQQRQVARTAEPIPPSHAGERKATQRVPSVVRSRHNRIYGSIIEVKQDSIYVRFDESLRKFEKCTGVDPHDERYFIRFMNNRTTFLLEHQALKAFAIDQPFEFVFPSSADERPLDYDGADAILTTE